MSDLKKLKLISPIATIMLVLFVSGTLLIMSGAGSTFAFVVEGSEIGLEVNVADEFTDVSNLAPGDTKSSYLTVSNKGSGTFKYFFDIKKIGSTAGSYRGTEGKPLDEILKMTVKRGEETLFDGLISNFEEKDMGDLAAGDEQRLEISVYFPEEAGNEYQGADVTVQFKFRAVCDQEEKTMLEVRKFRDNNRNGEWDSGEPEIEGWTVFINDDRYSTPQALELEPGTYTVREATRSGWRASTPTEYTVTLEAGDQETVLFGNYEISTPPPPPPPPPGRASLSVYKFYDADADGVWDIDEVQLESWTVFVNDEEYETPLTLELAPGEYTVAEEVLAGWVATTPPEVVVVLEEGDRETVIFGNFAEREYIIPPERPVVPPVDVTEIEMPPEPPETGLPKTGEYSRPAIYAIGVLIIVAGLLLRKKALAVSRNNKGC